MKLCTAGLFLKVFAFIAVCLPLQAGAQSLMNLHIGDDQSELSTLGVPTASDAFKSYTVSKWTLANRNELSVTVSSSGKIVYIEYDWGGQLEGKPVDLLGLRFGETNLT